MNLQVIRVQKLFGKFDYTISLNQEEGISILTGPNGYGKTTVLNIIYNLFKQNFFFFQKLVFENIIFYFQDNRNIKIYKDDKNEIVQYLYEDDQQLIPEKHSFIDVHFVLEIDGHRIEEFVFNSEEELVLLKTISKSDPRIRISRDQVYDIHTLYDTRTDSYIDIEDYILNSSSNSFEVISNLLNRKAVQLNELITNNDVYLIKAQRLIKINKITRRFDNRFSAPEDNVRPFSFTILSYSKELKDLINQKQAEAFQISQELDNSFPSRLMQNESKLSPDEFNSRFEILTKKQRRLQQFGITISEIQVPPEYNEGKADVLSVYLDDSEKKTNFFDDLVTKIDLFVTRINEKQFAHKIININSKLGFYFKTDHGNDLSLTALSSGEQEEVVLLYEMLFRTNPNTLILIDEPEISLHVSWQRTFVNDLLAISSIKHISFLLATHSPQIINNRWDMVTDLYELAEGKGYLENDE